MDLLNSLLSRLVCQCLKDTLGTRSPRTCGASKRPNSPQWRSASGQQQRPLPQRQGRRGWQQRSWLQPEWRWRRKQRRLQHVRRQQRLMLCAAMPAALFMLTTMPTQTSSCWPWMHLESVRRGGQPSTPIAALPEEASMAAVLPDARTAVELLLEARTAAALRAEAHLMAARWRPSGCGRGLLSWRLRWPVTDNTAGSTESAPLTGGATPSPQTGAKAVSGSRPSSGTVGGLPSPRPTMLSGPRS
ncbi:hypothetical protein GQ55_2G217100 [Panicum hallii var. hallii]|uniref:Uncharacterized protein n=1 Tax=Panicum hallii var. hallii TaxID=1504633 RepID=A0A2T7ER42_9POAL|nr:hypothetical protein GQ55_2G217100 [Panicum hallii var. hallii]